MNYEKYRTTDHSLQVLLRTVNAFHERDSILFGGYLLKEDSSVTSDSNTFNKDISYKWNSIHVEFSSPYFGGIVEYSSRLKGYEKEWSTWSKKTERLYTNLPSGDYTFEVMARNSTGHRSLVSQFIFTISPPWSRPISPGSSMQPSLPSSCTYSIKNRNRNTLSSMPTG